MGRRQVVTHRPAHRPSPAVQNPQQQQADTRPRVSLRAHASTRSTRLHTSSRDFRNTSAPAMSPSPLTSRRARDTFFQFSKAFNVTVKKCKRLQSTAGKTLRISRGGSSARLGGYLPTSRRRACLSPNGPSAVLRPHPSRAGRASLTPGPHLVAAKSHCCSVSSGPEAASQDILLSGR